jgi:hypothetical protein
MSNTIIRVDNILYLFVNSSIRTHNYIDNYLENYLLSIKSNLSITDVLEADDRWWIGFDSFTSDDCICAGIFDTNKMNDLVKNMFRSIWKQSSVYNIELNEQVYCLFNKYPVDIIQHWLFNKYFKLDDCISFDYLEQINDVITHSLWSKSNVLKDKYYTYYIAISHYIKFNHLSIEQFILEMSELMNDIYSEDIYDIDTSTPQIHQPTVQTSVQEEQQPVVTTPPKQYELSKEYMDKFDTGGLFIFTNSTVHNWQ